MPKNRIIGFAYVQWHGEYFAADLYEGNIVHYPDGNIDSIPERIYQKNLSQYQELVSKGERIATAYEANLKMGKEFYFQIPHATADPEAADKEWYQRTHPEIFSETHPQEPEQKKRGLFGRKRVPREGSVKEGKRIFCPSCGASNEEGKKFCGDCGAYLRTAPGASKENEPEETGKAPFPTPETEKEPRGQALSQKEGITDAKEDEEKEARPSQIQRPAKREPKKMQGRPEERRKQERTKPASNPGSEEEVPVKSRLDAWKDVSRDEADGGAKKRRPVTTILLLLVLAVLLALASAASALYLSPRIHNSLADAPAPAADAQQVKEPFVAVMFTRDLAVDEKIESGDLEGCILNEEQHERYTNISTYINADGETVLPELLSWEELDAIIGKRVTSDVKKGTLVYDTTITSQHVIADKTYVDATINGEDGTYEIEGSVLPGNTKIQIVAVVSTDGSDPVQVLLSELTLQDRSLESIFNSAGQDVLEMLAGEAEPSEEEAGEEGTSPEELETEEEAVSPDSGEGKEEAE